MEKNPDAYNDADKVEIKIEIKQAEALIKELHLSIKGSTTVFESLRIQVSTFDGSQRITSIMPIHNANTCVYTQITVMVQTLTRLELTYDKNLVLVTRREYIKVQLQLEECERRHQELFNPNIGKLTPYDIHI